MKIIQNKLLLTFLITLGAITSTFADDDPGFGNGDGGDPGAAPINNYIVFMIIAAGVIGFYFIQKTRQTREA